jgi:hypothetical protein
VLDCADDDECDEDNDASDTIRDSRLIVSVISDVCAYSIKYREIKFVSHALCIVFDLHTYKLRPSTLTTNAKLVVLKQETEVTMNSRRQRGVFSLDEMRRKRLRGIGQT